MPLRLNPTSLVDFSFDGGTVRALFSAMGAALTE